MIPREQPVLMAMVHAWRPSTWDVETGRLGVWGHHIQGHPGLHERPSLKAILGYTRDPVLKRRGRSEFSLRRSPLHRRDSRSYHPVRWQSPCFPFQKRAGLGTTLYSDPASVQARLSSSLVPTKAVCYQRLSIKKLVWESSCVCFGSGREVEG